jgi:hypothetical protein
VVPNLTPHGRVATSNGVVLWSMASASTPTPRHNRTQCGHSPAALYPRPLLPRARRPWPEPAHPHPAAACCSTPSTARARSSPRRRRRPSPGDERERERRGVASNCESSKANARITLRSFHRNAHLGRALGEAAPDWTGTGEAPGRHSLLERDNKWIGKWPIKSHLLTKP